MEMHEYLTYKNKFVELTDKLDELTNAIKSTLDPAKASILRSDYRQVHAEREQIMENLIKRSEHGN